MQIICCGNPGRGDDSAALLVARKLRELGVEAEIESGDALDLIESWDEDDEVTVVDATVTGVAPGTVQVWDDKLPEKLVAGTAATHGLRVGEAVYLAGILHRLPRRLRTYGIKGKQFYPGDEVSPK